MKKIILTAASLVVVAGFAVAQAEVTYGDVAVVNTPDSTVVVAEEVTGYTSSGAKKAKSAADAKKAVAKEQLSSQKAYQEKMGAKATQKANEAALKKGEPKLKTNTVTTTTDVYDISTKNKKGTTDYGIVEQTVTDGAGNTTRMGGVVYEKYTPSKVARANEKGREISVAGGFVSSFNKDDRHDRYSTNGFGFNVNMLWDVTSHLGMGLDYMMLHPNSRSQDDDGEYRRYHHMQAHNIALAGKFTLNPWDSVQFYLPMGWGMMNARMKTSADTLSSSEDKWGTAFYAGLGVQYDITDTLFAGLEYRYTYAFISDKHLSDFARDKNLQFHSAFLRLGMRF